MPAAAAAAGPTHAAHAHRAVVGRAPGRDAAGAGRYVGRLHPPAHVQLLAARLYWTKHPPRRPGESLLRKDLAETAAYYRHVSRGRETFRVTLTRWVHVRSDADIMCNTEHGSIKAARAGLRRAGYHPGRYNRLMILTEQCNSAASAAQLPGHVTWIRFRAPGMPTLVHELGHNLGLEHAYGTVCRQDGRRVALSPTCFPVEYGDSWDAMGHSQGFFSVPALVRLGWAGKIAHVRTNGTYHLADDQHSGSANQALEIKDGTTTYWVEYQPEHSPEIGQTIPGVLIRRQVGDGPVEIVDASPGNPTGIAYPDADLTNAALPVGSSLTTPGDIRITTVAAGRRATVHVAFHDAPAAPDAPLYPTAEQDASGYWVNWSAPPDNGQIVLGYKVTESPSGVTKYVTSPAGYRTSMRFPLGTGPQTFSVEALNQAGWSPASDTAPNPPPPVTSGPDVTVSSPRSGAKVTRSFSVLVQASPDAQSKSVPVAAWATIGSVACGSQGGPGPYTLSCTAAPRGKQTLTVHVQNAGGKTTDVAVALKVHGK